MGARKTSKKRNNPNRHKAFMLLRNSKDITQFFTLKNGAELVINPMKRFLLGKEYVHPELKREVLRNVAKWELSKNNFNQKGAE